VFLITAALFYKLTIKIDDQTLLASFGIGLIKKKVPLAEVVRCEPIRIRWSYGWGIHLTPYGWLYNISGLNTVATTLRDVENSRSALMILTGSPQQSELGFHERTLR
jgi:hypothetical protein